MKIKASLDKLWLKDSSYPTEGKESKRIETKWNYE